MSCLENTILIPLRFFYLLYPYFIYSLRYDLCMNLHVVYVTYPAVWSLGSAAGVDSSTIVSSKSTAGVDSSMIVSSGSANPRVPST